MHVEPIPAPVGYGRREAASRAEQQNVNVRNGAGADTTLARWVVPFSPL